MQFEYYVLNYDFNKKRVENFNIFCNIRLNEETEKEVRKYLRAPKKYNCKERKTDTILYGFDALCEEIRSLIMWQEWSRVEYEIFVGDAFETDLDKFEKWDCYKQCEPNISIITREVIYQYKKQLKERESNGKSV